MMMMEGIEEAASLDPSSPNYATPPRIQSRSSSPSAQLTSVFATTTPGNFFYPSSASHTIFPPSITTFPSSATTTTTTTSSTNQTKNNHNIISSSSSSSVANGDSHVSSSRHNDTTSPSDADTTPIASGPPISEADLEEIITNPWNGQSRTEFHRKFNPALNSTYKNKLRLAPDAEARVRHFLLHPQSPLDPNSPSDARLKARSKSYTLFPYAPHGHLYRTETTAAGSGSGVPGVTTLRRHVGEREVWDLLTSEHMKSGHKGRDRMLALIKERFVGYTLEELMFVLGSCRVCARARGVGGGGVELARRVRRSLGVVGVQQQESPPPLVVVSPAAQGAARREGRMGGAQSGSGAVAGVGVAALPVASQARTVPPAMAQLQQQILAQQQVVQGQQRQGNKRMMFAGRTEPQPKRSLYAPDERGMVAYDVPDWYC